MRDQRTNGEKWAIEQLFPLLESEGETWTEDPDVNDRPDLALIGEDGKRIACEIATVGLNEWHRWSNDPTYQLDAGELDEIIAPREPDYWLKMVLAAKSPKIPDYLARASASEAWLLIHGDTTNDFFVFDDNYDIPVMSETALLESHDFARIYAASPISRSRKIARVFPPVPGLPKAPDLSKRSNVKQVEIRAMKAAQLKPGVNYIAIGQEFRPDRQIVLPMLDKDRT